MASVNLTIKPVQAPPGANAAEFQISVDMSATVEELKEKVSLQVNIPANSIRLVCVGRIWQDAQTVGSYEPKDGNVVHCLHNPAKDTPAPTEQTLAPANPVTQMMGAAAPPANSGDPFSQMMAQTQQQMMQNPEMMQQLMSSPMVQQMMNNPEVLRAMVRMNPQLNELMEQRPEIARMLEDPELLQQSLRMVANPSLMREMTRNADRALGQLDAMPGGHNALVRAHEEFADPLFEAMAGGSSASGNTAVIDYSQDTTAGPNSEALPNPWGASPAPAAATPAPAPANPLAGVGANPLGGFGANPLGGFGANPLGGYGAPAPTQPSTQTPAGQTANPFGGMMQQMMSNPALMSMMMNPAMNPFAGGTGGYAAGAPLAQAPAQTPELQRARFASQLTQLSAMGFTNEAACLRALAQHEGRLDAAIDTLLSGDGNNP
eukprot:CAMPEP_0181433712 /NCGR_PEP_ID=MMETSP1110-20121109/19440_1 /TAXON_ID=174948 /ORGANISM="Symbiodinium sp., Strain CCMP421" /LENGTH=432 /DNA_ID=CAMNT_0023557187 /DNA_START=62 /DNA_END=1360 /DNA_ORIENTATION=+